MKGFTTFQERPRSFRITFDNGLTISTVWHHFSYSDAASPDTDLISRAFQQFEPEVTQKAMNSPNAEIAIWAEESKHNTSWRTRAIAKKEGWKDPKDDVLGYVTPETWLKWAEATKNWSEADEERYCQQEDCQD